LLAETLHPLLNALIAQLHLTLPFGLERLSTLDNLLLALKTLLTVKQQLLPPCIQLVKALTMLTLELLMPVIIARSAKATT
jgi:hypothetical protein